MPVRNIRSRRPKILIPTVSDVFAKITITDDSSIVYTVLDSYGGADADNHSISARVTRIVTDGLGNFEFRIANDGGRFLDKFDGGEVVNIYADTTDATTLIFRGKIDNVEYGLNMSDGFYMDVSGRDYPEMIDTTITGVEASAAADIGLAGILNSFFSDVTLTFWNGSIWATAAYTASTDTVTWSVDVSALFPTTAINMTYQHKKAWNVITEICKRVGLDCYMEYDGSKWTLRTFLKDTITNSSSNISYGANLVSLDEYGVDNNEIVNRVIIYGNTESDNVLLLKSEEDSSSQSNLWIKDRVFNESSLESMTEVQDKANFELAVGINTDATGRVNALCLPTLKPGNTITVVVPYCNINGTYKVHSFTHTFGNPFSTSLELSKKIKVLKDLFVPKVNAEEFVGALSNPNNMKNSYTIYFNEDPSIITHSNTEEIDGKLRLQDTKTTGFAITDTLITDSDVTECELRRYENFETSTDVYEVSNTGGTTWETYIASEGNTHKFAVLDNRLALRITLNRVNAGDTSPSYESLCLLYK